MSLCINPYCPQPDRPDNLNHRYCQSCGSDLLLEERDRVMRLLNSPSHILDVIENVMARISKQLPIKEGVLLQGVRKPKRQLIQPPKPPRKKRRLNLPLGVATGLLVLVGLGDVGGDRYLQASPCAIKKATYCINTQANTLSGHSNEVSSVAISPDGQTLASGSFDKTIKIWNLATGDLIRTLEGHLHWVWSVAISPDGQTIASGSFDKTIKIWNLATGDLIRTLEGHFGMVNSVAISPDGQTLASGSGDDTIKIWNLATGDLIRTLEGHSDTVFSVAISPDGQTLVSGSDDNTIKIWQKK